jgi:galactokinase
MIESAADPIQRFTALFGPGAPVRGVRAPGRTNLIGEHVDYQEGLVLPMAVEQAVRVWCRPRSDRRLRVRTDTFDETREADLDRPLERTGTWFDYAQGVAWVLQSEGLTLPGLDCLAESDLPIAAGLSSSAAVEVAFALAFLGAMDLVLDRVRLANLCRRAENEFVGVGCGIMDQFACLHGRADHALLLDCRSLDYEEVPLPSERVRVVLADTGMPRSLAASAYNERLRECAEGVARLRRWAPAVRTLRDVEPGLLSAHFDDLPPVVARRCRHVVSEIARVGQAVAALRAGDLAAVGRLLAASHESLRDDYGVSSPELDEMVDAALALPGVFGARLTGAGFGGCTVNLVAPPHLGEFCARLAEAYRARTGRTATLYVTRPADGAGKWGQPP